MNIIRHIFIKFPPFFIKLNNFKNPPLLHKNYFSFFFFFSDNFWIFLVIVFPKNQFVFFILHTGLFPQLFKY